MNFADYRLRHTGARLRDIYESGDSHAIAWVPGDCSLAELFSKANNQSFFKVKQAMVREIIVREVIYFGKRNIGR